LIAFADALSLALCGDLRAPLELEAPGHAGETVQLRLADKPGAPFTFTLSPWPFGEDALTFEGEARALPAEGRFPDEAAMRRWSAAPERVAFQARLLADR
jgi:hypothetical protein